VQNIISSNDTAGAKTLRRGLAILSLFSTERTVLRQAEIAELLGIPLPTVGRLCRTLTLDHYLEQDAGTRQLRLGPQIMRLSGRSNTGLTEDTRRWMSRLNATFDEDVNIAILDGIQALYLDAIPSTKVLSTQTAVGSRALAHCTAIGKSLLSQLDDAVILDRLGRGPYEGRTAHTIRHWEDLQPELDRIRATGVSRSIDEYEEGLSGFATTLGAGPSGAPMALSVAVPNVRCTPERANEIVRALTDPHQNPNHSRDNLHD
jgi:DNA-binding IclR family transcriptional regulator